MPKASTKSTAKKPVKRSAATKVTTKKRVTSAERQFMEFKTSEETIYWIIFGVVSIMFALWIFSIDTRVQNMYDQIDSSYLNTSEATNTPAPEVQEEVAE